MTTGISPEGTAEAAILSRPHGPNDDSTASPSVRSACCPFAQAERSSPWTCQYTNTSTAACSADFTTSLNFRCFVSGSLSVAATSGTDSRKLRRRLAVVMLLLPVQSGLKAGLLFCRKLQPDYSSFLFQISWSYQYSDHGCSNR